jgi:nitroreductase
LAEHVHSQVKSMDFYEVIRNRRSVRNFKSTPVAPAVLERIWEAVQLAPSACNLQPWRFLLIKSPQMRARLKGILSDWAFTAPLIVAAVGNRREAWKRDGESIHSVDVAIATEHLILAATAEGLGACWVCAFDRNAAQAALGLSSEWEAVAMIPLGYPDDSSPRNPRKSIAEIIREI